MGRDGTIYYNEMVFLWQELDQCYNDGCDCPKDSVNAMKREENERVYLFLAGLNQEFDELRSQILEKKPLPTLRGTFSEIRREETRRNVILKIDPNLETKNKHFSSLVVAKNENDRLKKPWCDFAKNIGTPVRLVGKSMGNRLI